MTENVWGERVLMNPDLDPIHGNHSRPPYKQSSGPGEVGSRDEYGSEGRWIISMNIRRVPGAIFLRVLRNEKKIIKQGCKITPSPM